MPRKSVKSLNLPIDLCESLEAEENQSKMAAVALRVFYEALDARQREQMRALYSSDPETFREHADEFVDFDQLAFDKAEMSTIAQ